MIFYNQFASSSELIHYLQTATLYIIPYPKKEQITSGTMVYAMASGAPIISTPFWHAEEVLADGKGYLVPFQDPVALAEAIDYLLNIFDFYNMDLIRMWVDLEILCPTTDNG